MKKSTGLVYIVTVAISMAMFVVAAHGKTEIFPDSVAYPWHSGADNLQSGTKSLNLCGKARLKAYKVFTVGEGALYRPDCTAGWDADNAEPKVMFFHYHREIPAHAFAESATTILKRNLRLNTEQQAELKLFHESYQAVQDGDTYALKYSPQLGLELFLNDRLLGKLKTQPLASQYFNIWLGQEPFDETLKKELLGR